MQRSLGVLILVLLVGLGVWWGRNAAIGALEELEPGFPAPALSRVEDPPPKLPLERPTATDGSRVNAAPSAVAKSSPDAAELVTLTGRVVLAGTTKPVPGGRVSFDLIVEQKEPALLARMDSDTLAETIDESLELTLDEEGRFTLTLAADAWIAQARMEPPKAKRYPELGSWSVAQFAGFVPTTKELRLRAREQEGPLRLEVESGIRITGRVVDAVDGAGIEGVQVVTQPLPRVRWGCVSDARGEFELLGVERAAWMVVEELALSALHPSYVEGCARVALPAEGLPAERVDLRLTRGVTLEGRVVDELGQGVEGIAVAVQGYGSGRSALGRNLSVYEWTRSGAAGEFRLPTLPPTSELELATVGLHGRVGDRIVLDATSSRADLVLRVLPGTAYHVRALAPSGEPVDEEALVVLLAEDDRPPRVVPSRFVVASDRAFDLELFAQPTPADESDQSWRGRMRVRPTGTGEVLRELELRLERRAPAPATPQASTYRIGMRAPPHAQRTLDLSLRDADSGLALEEGTRVGFEGGGGRAAMAMRAGARFRLDLPLGTHVIELKPAGYEPLRVEARSLAPGYEESILSFERQRD